MSITNNKFKSTTIYGNFSNVNDTASNITAKSFFAGSVTISGNLSLPDYPNVYSTLKSLVNNTYITLSGVLFYNNQLKSYTNSNFTTISSTLFYNNQLTGYMKMSFD